MTRPQWLIGLAILALAVLAVPAMAQDDGETQTSGEQVAFEPVGELMRMIGSAEEANRETVAEALRGFMDGLLSFLGEKGVPDTALSNIENNFQDALDQFLADGTSTDEFGNQMANIARQMATEAQLEGVDGVPFDVLEEAGIPSEVVDDMADGNVPDEAKASEVAESAAEAADETGPPEEGEQGPPDDEDEGQGGPPDDDEQGPPDDEDEGQDPPDDNEQGPPDDNDDEEDGQGPPDDSGPPGDDQGGPPGN